MKKKDGCSHPSFLGVFQKRTENFWGIHGNSGIRAFALGDMLSDPEIRAVTICTANQTHAVLTAEKSTEIGRAVEIYETR